MRFTPFSFLLFLSIASYSQVFTVDKGQMKWQHVYNTDLSEDEIKEIVAKDPFLSILQDLKGNVGEINIDCSQSTPIYMRDGLTFFVNIEVKEGRYRVTASSFRLVPASTAEFMGVETSNKAVPLEDFQIKNNGELRGNKLHTNSRNCIENYLTDLFEFKKVDDAW